MAWKNLQTVEEKDVFEQADIRLYAEKFEALYKEYIKYQCCLIENEEDCDAVRRLLNPERVHVSGTIGLPISGGIDWDLFDYVIVCSHTQIDGLESVERMKVIRFDFLRYCAWQISPESAYLELNLKQRLQEGAEGMVTGLSYQQRGLNLDNIGWNIVCLATPSQDLFVDYHSLMWAYKKIMINGRKTKYCVLGMDFYRLWYDMSLSEENQIRMLVYYKGLRDMHHFHQMDGWMVGPLRQ